MKDRQIYIDIDIDIDIDIYMYAPILPTHPAQSSRAIFPFKLNLSGIVSVRQL